MRQLLCGILSVVVLCASSLPLLLPKLAWGQTSSALSEALLRSVANMVKVLKQGIDTAKNLEKGARELHKHDLASLGTIGTLRNDVERPLDAVVISKPAWDARVRPEDLSNTATRCTSVASSTN